MTATLRNLATLVIEGANLAAFGTLWLAQFAILDRLLFANRPDVRQDHQIAIDAR